MPIDYSEYPPNWLTEIRPRILARANNCCETCGVPNGAIILRNKKDGSWRKICGTEHDWIRAKIRGGCSRKGAIRILGFTEIVLTIAHVNHDKHNWDIKDEELRAECQRCHLKRDHARHIENRKYGRNRDKYQVKLDL